MTGRDRDPLVIAGAIEQLQRRVLGVPIVLVILFLAFADLMLAFPEIDLTVSEVFYTPGSGFEARGRPWERFFYRSLEILMVLANLALVALWLVNRWTGRTLLGLDGRKLLFLLCLLALVPGLLVNQVLKENWGRARPVDVVELGGHAPFTPPFVYVGHGGGSFSSGHVAAACYLVAVGRTLFGARSRWSLAMALYAAMVGLARIAAGGHFFSDVVTSCFLMLIGYLALHRVFFGER
jgi:lipid A 4'-phosphatase